MFSRKNEKNTLLLFGGLKLLPTFVVFLHLTFIFFTVYYCYEEVVVGRYAVLGYLYAPGLMRQ